MKIHILVDFTYLYYKYKFTIESNRIRRLISNVEQTAEDGTVQIVPTDMSYIYYPIKEIEGFRRQFEKEGHDVKLSVCFDSPSMRKEVNGEYKSNRGGKLHEEDFARIDLIRKTLTTAGYNIYYIEGYEADDLIANLLKQYENDFDYNVVYTPDTDLIVHINSHVGVMRYKAGKNHMPVNVGNFSEYCSAEFKCNIPYNGLLLYKVLCGDKSDVIKGVKGFGPKAFDRFVEQVYDKVEWERAGDVEYIKQVLNDSAYFFSKDAIEQIRESISMVGYISVDGGLDIPDKMSNIEHRTNAYMPLQMKSLID